MIDMEADLEALTYEEARDTVHRISQGGDINATEAKSLESFKTKIGKVIFPDSPCRPTGVPLGRCAIQ